VRQAYKNILAIYEESSLATYALFAEDERKAILGKIEKAMMKRETLMTRVLWM
jgi:cytochrome c551/c552